MSRPYGPGPPGGPPHPRFRPRRHAIARRRVCGALSPPPQISRPSHTCCNSGPLRTSVGRGTGNTSRGQEPGRKPPRRYPRSHIPGGLRGLVAWNVAWNGQPEKPRVDRAMLVPGRAICAGSAHGAVGHTSCKRQVSGSNPLTGSLVKYRFHEYGGQPRLFSPGTFVPGRARIAANVVAPPG